MDKRMQLNDDMLDEVVGGAFNFYTNSKGQKKCVVDGVGTYYVDDAAFTYIIQITSDPNVPAQDAVNQALAAGHFSTSPF